ncbi:DNA-binding protein WhiA [Candidatus Phytoplasma asteris]|uniref:Probable cell division protein WhiA n=1 Tax=Candidatus Phytoplasma asteris TaxID=85620 RepID=A0ABZ2YEX4_9MOLU
MSFNIKIKEEIACQKFLHIENFFELTALLHFGCELEKNHQKTLLWFQTKSIKIARRFLILIKTFYPDTNSFLMTSKEYNLPHLKSIHVGIEKDIPLILEKHHFFTQNSSVFLPLIKSQKSKKAFLRGIFLCIGFVNDPKKTNYHLEFFHKDSNKIELIKTLMLHFGLNAKQINHKKGFLVYLKESQMIIDFLRLIGALEMVFQYEKTIIQKDLNHIIKSSINFEISNEKKILTSANLQLKQINLIEKYFQTPNLKPKNTNIKNLKSKKQLPNLEPKLLQIMLLRKKNHDASLQELTQKYYNKHKQQITKSGLNYYFQKIKKIACEIETAQTLAPYKEKK